MMIERLKLPLGRLKLPSNNHSKAVITFVLIKVVVLDFFGSLQKLPKKCHFCNRSQLSNNL